MNTAKRPPLARLPASVVLALLIAGATLTASLPSLASATPQPLITEVQPVDGLLRISGFNMGGTATAITLGGRVLRVVGVTSTGVDAELPQFAPGSYLLTLTVGSGGSQRSDEFWVTLGALGPQGPAGADGAVGPQGPAGPAGATGQQGLAGPVGPQGMTGAQGPTGAAGAQGPMGPQGSTAPAGTPSTVVVRVIRYWSEGDSFVTVTAECPAGSVLTGGAAHFIGYDTHISEPSQSGTGWEAWAITPVFPSPTTTSIFVHAICLRIN
jgi:hypothetical protein